MVHKNRKGHNKQILKKFSAQYYPIKKSFWRKVWDFLGAGRKKKR